MRTFTFFISICLFLFSFESKAQTEFLGSENYGTLKNFVYDPVIENKLYATTMGNHIMVSKDNGDTWDVLYSFPNLDRPPRIQEMQLTGDSTSLSFIEDYGASFHNKVSILNIESAEITNSFWVPNDPEESAPELRSYSLHALDSEVILLHTAVNLSHHIVFYSDDGGDTWSEVYDSDDHQRVMIQRVAICPVNPQKLYLSRFSGYQAVDFGGIWISEDAGQTWEEKLGGLVLSSIGINPSDPDDIYVGSAVRWNYPDQEQAVYRSLDGGETWAMLPIEFDDGWGGGSYDFVTAIVHNPSNTNTILILEENETIISTDNGATWDSYVQPGTPDDNFYWYGRGATFNPYNENQVYIYDFSYPLVSFDGGETLEIYPNRFFRNTGDVNFFDDGNQQHLYYGVQWGYIHKDYATGLEVATDVQPLNQEYMWGPPLIRMFIDQTIPGRAFTYSGNFNIGYTLEVSNDHGQNKTPILQTQLADIHALEPDPNNSDIVWVSLSEGAQEVTLYKIDFSNIDNIISTPVDLPEDDSFINGIAVSPDNSDFILITLGNKVFKSNDDGSTWIDSSNGLENLQPSDMINELVKDPLNNKQFSIATTKGIFTTHDNGSSWIKISDIPVSNVGHSTANDSVMVGVRYPTWISDFELVYSIDAGDSWEYIGPEDFYYANIYSSAFRYEEDVIMAYLHTTDLGLIKYTIDFSTPELFNLILDTNPENSGEVIGEGEYAFEEDVTIEAIANEDYDFSYWALEEGEIISYDSKHTFSMPESDLKIIAHFDFISSVSETQAKSPKVFPNPAQNEVFINFFNESSSETVISLVDINGQVLIQETKPQAGLLSARFSLQGIKPGLYFVKINTEKKSFVKKIIVQ